MDNKLKKVKVTWTTELYDQDIEKLIEGLNDIHQYIYGFNSDCVLAALEEKKEYIDSINNIKIEIKE